MCYKQFNDANVYICIGYHMRSEVISILSLARRYHCNESDKTVITESRK